MSTLNDAMRVFLYGRHYATLATVNEDGSMHLTPVWYLFENECFFIDTAASDRKVRNILARPEVSIVVDSRTPGAERWVSTTGQGEIVRGEEAKALNAKILQRYLTKAGQEEPRVGAVFEAAADATIAIKPQVWRAWDLKNLDEQFFGGMLAQTPQQWFLPVD
jgi:PPOX class probable F420-dependent enzyme